MNIIWFILILFPPLNISFVCSNCSHFWIGYWVFGIWYLVSRIWYLVFGIWIPTTFHPDLPHVAWHTWSNMYPCVCRCPFRLSKPDPKGHRYIFIYIFIYIYKAFIIIWWVGGCCMHILYQRFREHQCVNHGGAEPINHFPSERNIFSPSILST